MKDDYKIAYALLKEELCKAVLKDREDLATWKMYLNDIPFCEIVEISGEEILKGSLFKGRINLWRAHPILDYHFQDDDYDEEDLSDPNREVKRRLTAKFFFKEKNRAYLEYPPYEGLPRFVGTWSEIFLEIIDFVRRKSCEDPVMLRHLGERMRMLQYSQEN